MPRKMARSDPSTAVQVADVTASDRTARLSCWKAGKVRIFTSVRDSSGESRLKLSRLKSCVEKSYPYYFCRGNGLEQSR